MAKVIRIGELPSSRSLTNEDLFVVNSFVEDRTYAITWADLVGNIKEINQPVFFSRGSETKPSIAFVDFNAGFYSPGPSSVAVTTSGTTRMSFDGDGNIDVGTSCGVGAVVFHSPVTYSCDTKFEQNVEIDGDINVQGNISVNGELDIIGNIGVEIEGNLVVGGDVSLGDPNSGCAGFFEVYSQPTFFCNSYFEQNLTVGKNITVGETTSTDNLVVLDSTELRGSVLISDDVDINGEIFIDASQGDVTLSGNLNVGGVLTGDGSGITNLNIPGSLSFKGNIDLTSTAPSNPQTGDLYITDYGPGTVHFSYTGISGQVFEANQFVFFTVDNTWSLGSAQNSSGFVTLSGDQTITGEKTYTSVLNAFAGINASGQLILANDLTLTGKGVSASTVDGDLGKTLTTKDYVDDRSLNAVADFPLTLGNYITGTPYDFYDGEFAITANIDATPTNTPNFIVARDVNGNFAANEITADLIGRADITNKLDINVADSSATKSYPLFTRDPIPTSGSVAQGKDVFADSGLHYLPSTNTLTTTRIVADVTGNITGNTDTATALETPRTLWGQTFDGTANVSGNMVNVGDVLSQQTETKNIGSPSNVWANVYATTFHGYLSGSASIAERTKEKLTAGLHILSTNGVDQFDGSAATTWYVDTSSDNTPSKIVVRDLDGSFSSNVITANEFVGPLTGDVTGNVSGSSGSSTGNAATATALQTPRTLWGQTFDGTANITGDLSDTGHLLPSSGSAFELGSSDLTYARIYVDTIIGNVSGNSGSANKVNNPLTRGQFISGGPLNFDGSVPGTWNIDASPNNAPNFIVARDGNGDFDAGTITATFIGNLTGDVTGNVSGSSGSSTGNAATATALQTPRTLWGQSFDGTTNITGDIVDTGNVIPTTNLSSTIGTPDLQYSDIYATTFHGNLNGVADTADKVNHSLFRGVYIKGTYPSFNGENDDTWDVDATPSNVPNKIVARDAAGNFYANNVTANQFVGDVTGNVTGNVTGSSGFCTGNAATATKLETSRNVEVQITGATIGSGSASFDGTSDIEIIVPTEGIVDLQSLTALPE
jgi:hypothetical protein